MTDEASPSIKENQSLMLDRPSWLTHKFISIKLTDRGGTTGSTMHSRSQGVTDDEVTHDIFLKFSSKEDGTVRDMQGREITRSEAEVNNINTIRKRWIDKYPGSECPIPYARLLGPNEFVLIDEEQMRELKKSQENRKGANKPGSIISASALEYLDDYHKLFVINDIKTYDQTIDIYLKLLQIFNEEEISRVDIKTNESILINSQSKIKIIDWDVITKDPDRVFLKTRNDSFLDVLKQIRWMISNTENSTEWTLREQAISKLIKWIEESKSMIRIDSFDNKHKIVSSDLNKLQTIYDSYINQTPITTAQCEIAAELPNDRPISLKDNLVADFLNSKGLSSILNEYSGIDDLAEELIPTINNNLSLTLSQQENMQSLIQEVRKSYKLAFSKPYEVEKRCRKPAKTVMEQLSFLCADTRLCNQYNFQILTDNLRTLHKIDFFPSTFSAIELLPSSK